MRRQLAICIVTFASLTLSHANAQCRLGTDAWVTAIDSFSVHARWDSSNADQQIYNPPSGYAIAETKLERLSEHWGSAGVSVVASDSHFAVSESFSSATNYALDIYGKYLDDEARFKINQAASNGVNYAKQFDSTHNAVVAQISAQGSGNFFDQQSGWMIVSVKARLICVGSPNTEELASQIAIAAGLPETSTIEELHVTNSCNQKIRLAVMWQDVGVREHTEYWWDINPGVTPTTLKTKDGRIVASRVLVSRGAQFFIYGEAGDRVWKGAGDFQGVVEGKTRDFIEIDGGRVRFC